MLYIKVIWELNDILHLYLKSQIYLENGNKKFCEIQYLLFKWPTIYAILSIDISHPIQNMKTISSIRFLFFFLLLYIIFRCRSLINGFLIKWSKCFNSSINEISEAWIVFFEVWGITEIMSVFSAMLFTHKEIDDWLNEVGDSCFGIFFKNMLAILSPSLYNINKVF